jgi:branched-chain amino acid transport system ATP-binding protein
MILLSIEGVFKNFGGLQALSNIYLNVEKGKITAVIGPNGAGKTTLFNIVTGIDKLSAGSLFFNGERINGLSPYEITNRGIARTFQIVRVFKGLSVLENVMIGRHTRTKVGVAEILGRLPSARSEELATQEYALNMLRFVNLENQPNRLSGTLPHGQQRLIELARALASEPTLLLLDEPCGGLNAHEVMMLQKMIKSIQSMGITIFLIEHDMRLVMNMSDHVVVLNYGQKIAEGPPKIISGDPAVVRAYLGKESIDALP